jgi:hypothetical protein
MTKKLGGLTPNKIIFTPQDVELTDEELFKVKEAITAERNFVDLVRGETRIKLNLRNFIYLIS